MRFLSPPCKCRWLLVNVPDEEWLEEEVDVMDADEDEGEEAFE